MVILLTTRFRKAIALVLGGILAAFLAVNIVRQAYVRWSLQQPSKDLLRKAISLDSGECSAYHRLGLYYVSVPEELDLTQGEELLRRALRCQPLNASYWLALAYALQTSGRTDESASAAEKAAGLDAHNSTVLWRGGNLLLLAGKNEEAFDMFHRVLEGAPQFAPQVFTTCWKASSDGEQILRRVVPDTVNLNVSYLQFLSKSSKLEEARKVWDRLVNLGQVFPTESCFPYLDALLNSDRAEEVIKDWNQLVLAGVLPRGDLYQAEGPVVNGGFELQPVNGGLDWRISTVAGAPVQIDSQTRHSGTRSLLVQFEGLSNLDFHHVGQIVPVRPETDYRFSAFVKSRELTTQSGPYFEIFDLKEPRKSHWETLPVLGTTDWAEISVSFRTGPHTQLVAIRLRRKPALELDKRIEGALWVDDVQLAIQGRHG
jgi:tetratricopeptide (TPR) repeat protein